ncbi:MAG: complex I NDUFA9 subunit family protein [bacterium]
MKVAITGASGFLGRHLVACLGREGHDVIALRHRRSASSWGDISVRELPADVDDVLSLRQALVGVEAVVHLVGILTPTKTKTFEGTVVQGTRNLVAAATDAGVSRLVYISAMGTGPKAQSGYHQAKYLAELAIAASGIDYVILRPSVIYGDGDGFVSLLSRMIKRSPVLPYFGSGRYQMQPVFIDDVTRSIARCLTDNRTIRQIIDIGGPEKLEYLQILDIITGILKRRRLKLRLPLVVGRAMAAVLEMFLKPAPLTRDQLIMMQAGNTGNIEKMRNILGVDPVGFQDGLARYLR